MSEGVRLDIEAAEALAAAALVTSRTSPANAAPTARALVAAEVDGQPAHGLSRVLTYALQSRAGKVDGFATPSVEQVASAALRVNGNLGFAYPAIDLAISQLVPLARACGIATAAIFRSHHFGQAGAHAERIAREGIIALVFGNTPKAMAFWGGSAMRLGTNPLAFAAPLGGGPQGGDSPPLVVDLAMTVAARAKIIAAQKAGRSIPSDWAVDSAGQPTTDPTAALAGRLLPIGGAKGGALALMIEVLAAAVTGSHFGWEASSMFDDQGGPPNLGHLFIALDPQRLSGRAYDARMSELLDAIAAESDVRLPGSRRVLLRERATREGIVIPASLHADIRALAAREPA
jgi:(2R)-3-sulfolactate dehydrogenase (NADP+)